MGAITGRESVVGIKKAATWATPVALGADDGILIKSWGVKPDRVRNKDDSIGVPFIASQDKGRESAAGAPTAYMRYEGIERVIAFAMGLDTISAEITPSQGDFQHEMSLTTGIFGRMVTMAALMKSDSAHQIDTAKVTGFEITMEQGNPTEISFDVLGNTITKGSNTLVSAVTVKEGENRVVVDNLCEILFNGQSAGALASPADRIFPTKTVFSFKRSSEGDWIKGLLAMDEPDDTGHPEITVTFTFPRYSEDVFYDAWQNDTKHKASIKFIGAQIASGVNRAFELHMPHLRATAGEPDLAGPGKIPQEVTFEVLAMPPGAAAPAGFLLTDFTPNLQADLILPFVALTRNTIAVSVTA